MAAQHQWGTDVEDRESESVPPGCMDAKEKHTQAEPLEGERTPTRG